MDKVKIGPPPGLYEYVAGPLLIDKLVLVVVLADGATWRCSLWPVFKDRVAYYRECGWYEDAEDAMMRGGRDLAKQGQPRGKELRNLCLANEDWEGTVNKCHWRKIKPKALHDSGPMTEPEDDLMWSVEECGGGWEVFAVIPPEEQRRADVLWTDRLEV